MKETEFKPIWALLAFVLWFVLSLWTILPDGLETVMGRCCGPGFGARASQADVAAYFGSMDAGSYIRYGINYAQHGSFFLNGEMPLWGPGMFWLHALLYEVLNPAASVVLPMAILTAAAWAMMCLQLSRVLFLYSRNYLSIVAPATVFAIPATRAYMLHDGIFFSEPISLAIFFTGTLLLVEASLLRSLPKTVIAGFLLLGAALFRATFEIVLQFATIILVMLLLVQGLWSVLERKRRRKAKSSSAAARNATRMLAGRDVGYLIVALLLFQAGAVTYKTYNLARYGSFQWVFLDYYFKYPWMRASEFNDQQYFVLQGGGNIACQIDEVQCDRFRKEREAGQPANLGEYRRALLKTFLTNPVRWHLSKLPILAQYWTSKPILNGVERGSGSVGVAFALALLVGIGAVLAVLARHGAWSLATLIGGFVGANYAVLLLLHLEVRYILTLKVGIPIIAMVGLAAARSAQRPQELLSVGQALATLKHVKEHVLWRPRPRGWYVPAAAGFWFVASLIAMLPSGPETIFSYCCGRSLGVFSTAAEVQAHFGASDAGSHARSGIQLAEHGALAAPPLSTGMTWLYAAGLNVVGSTGPVVLAMVLANALAWGILCSCLGAVLFRASGLGLAWAMPALLFLVAATWQYLFKIGIFYGDTLAVALWGCGAILLVDAVPRNSWQRAATAGLAFIGAGLFRRSFEIVSQLGFAVSLTIMILVIARAAWQRASRPRRPAVPTWAAWSRGIGAMIVAVLVFQAGEVAVRTFGLLQFGQFEWSFEGYRYEQQWTSPGLKAGSPSGRGGDAIACDLNPSACHAFEAQRQAKVQVSRAVYRDSLVSTFLSDPFRWQAMKLPVLYEYWNSSFTWGAPIPALLPARAINAVFLLSAIFLAVTTLVRHGAVVPIGLLGGLLGGSYTLLTLFRVEVRDLVPVQMILPILVLAGLAEYLRMGRHELDVPLRSGATSSFDSGAGAPETLGSSMAAQMTLSSGRSLTGGGEASDYLPQAVTCRQVS